MALSANTVWEVRTDGNDTNGGGFVTGASGTDWSQQAAAQYSVTDAVGNGTTAITSATAAFGTDVIGNICYFDGLRYQITARPSATEITVDRATTTGSGLTLKIGGACASPGEVAGSLVVSNRVYIKSGTYTITTTTANVSNGRINPTTDSYYPPVRWVGYDTNRSLFNTDTRPIIEVAASGVDTITMFAGTNSGHCFHNIIVDGKNKTAVRGFSTQAYNSSVVRCEARNCTNVGIFTGTSGDCRVIGSKAIGCDIGFSGRNFVFCTADSNTSHGFSMGPGSANFCLAINNGGKGIYSPTFQGIINGCTAYGNTSDGFYAGYQNGTFINCLSYGNGGYGFNGDSLSNIVVYLFNCATGNNTSGAYNVTSLRTGEIALTADPFSNSAGGDFALNDAVGGGALLRGAGYPQNIPVT